MVLIVATACSSVFAAKDKFTITAAFYGATTNWSDYTDAARKATYVQDGTLIIPMRETLNNIEILDGLHLLAVCMTFRDRPFSTLLGEWGTPFPKEITPKLIEEEYEKAKERPVIKTKHFEILGAYYGAYTRMIEVTHKLPQFVTEDGKLDASSQSKPYEYNMWTPNNDRTLVVFYKDKDGLKYKTALESDEANLTLP